MGEDVVAFMDVVTVQDGTARTARCVHHRRFLVSAAPVFWEREEFAVVNN